MKSNNQKIISKKLGNDLISRTIIFIMSLLAVVTLIVMFTMVIKEAIPSYKEYGFFHMMFTADYSKAGGYGIWGPLSVTLFTSIIAVLIAAPVSLRAAYLIHFRLKKSQKVMKIIINIIAGIPSVVFGIFALKSLGKVSGALSGTESNATIFNAIVMLTFMIIPTMISLNLNQLKQIPSHLIDSSMSLGNTKTHSIYKIVRKQIKAGFYVSIIVGLGRAIGETMALSMILGTGTNENPFSNGLLDFVNSSQKTLGASIASNMFTDSADAMSRSPHFAAGVSMFIITMILIGVVTKLSTTRIFKHQTPKQFIEENLGKNDEGFKKYLRLSYVSIKLPFNIIANIFSFLSKNIKKAFEFIIKLFLTPIYYVLTPKKEIGESNTNYFTKYAKSNLTKSFDILRISFELLSMILVLGFVGWIVGDVMSTGLKYWTINDWKFTRKFYDSTSTSGRIIEKPSQLANTLSFTLVIISITVLIAIPFAIATALYLSEYARKSKSGKTIRFFLDSLGGTPSILFGIFGMVFFANGGAMAISKGLSVMAGALTMFLVVIPTFTRSIEQVLVTVPDQLRDASYALGASKFETIRKVVLPQAIPGIITGIILSAGRIMSETAPLYLTVGMQGALAIDLSDQGWTMTTAIYNNQIYSTYSDFVRTATSYKIAALSIFSITGIILFAESIQPCFKLIKKLKLKIKSNKNKNNENTKGVIYAK